MHEFQNIISLFMCLTSAPDALFNIFHFKIGVNQVIFHFMDVYVKISMFCLWLFGFFLNIIYSFLSIISPFNFFHWDTNSLKCHARFFSIWRSRVKSTFLCYGDKKSLIIESRSKYINIHLKNNI
jgi:hypothetical protein